MKITFASLMWGVCCLCAVTPAATAQPVLRSVNPIENAASYMPPGLPSSGVAQGSIFSVFGTGIGPAAWTEPASFPLPTTLANRATSAAVAVQVVSAAFGIFTYGASGVGQAIATDPAYAINTIIHTFHPGDVGIIWGTGLGAINASDAGVPPVGSLPGDVQVYVGNTAAQVGYHGRSGCCAGLDQIVFTVPQAVDGCYVPLSVNTAVGTSNFTAIAVSQSGQTCTDSILGNDLVAKLAAGQDVNFGYILLENDFLKFVTGSTQASNLDLATATFSHLTGGAAGLAEYGISSGYCAAVACPGFSSVVP